MKNMGIAKSKPNVSAQTEYHEHKADESIILIDLDND